MKKRKDKEPITLTVDDLVDKIEEDFKKDEKYIEDIRDEMEGPPEFIPDDDKTPDDEVDEEFSESEGDETSDKESIEVESEWIEGESSRGEKIRKITTRIIWVLLVLLALTIGYLVMQFKQDAALPVEWASSKVEYGAKNFKPIKKLNGRTLVAVENLNTEVVGTYTIEAKVKDEDGKITTVSKEFTVEDTQKPTITTEKDELTIKLGETPNYNLLRIKAKDPVDGKVSYIIQDGGLSTIGDHKITIKATDSNGNTATKKITIHVTGYVTNTALSTYRQYVSKLNEAYEEAQKAKEEAEKAAKAEENSTGRVIWVGDSRFVGMSQVCNSDSDVYIAKGSMGYSWFANTAVSQVNSQLQKGDTIVVNIGVNGLEYEKLANKLNELASGDWKDYKVIYMSVNPVDEEKEVENGYSTTNDQIKEFNAYMKQHLGTNITYLDTYSSLIDDISSKTADGVHYSTSTSNVIYNMARAIISQ